MSDIAQPKVSRKRKYRMEDDIVDNEMDESNDSNDNNNNNDNNDNNDSNNNNDEIEFYSETGMEEDESPYICRFMLIGSDDYA